MSNTHSESTQPHVPGFVQDGDPGAVGAGKLWIKETTPFTVKKRNSANTGWDTLSAGASAGTVTSVAQTVPSEFSIGGSPITGAGTLAITSVNQDANKVWAGPTTGSPAPPGFRVLVFADVPTGTSSSTVAVGNHTHALPTGVPQAIFRQTNTGVVSNVTGATSLLSTGVGSLTLAGNTLAVGSYISLKAGGTYTSTSGGGNEWIYKLGSDVLTAVSGVDPGTPGGAFLWEVEFISVVTAIGGSGAIVTQGILKLMDVTAVGGAPQTLKAIDFPSTSPVIDTTASHAFDFTLQPPVLEANQSVSCLWAILTLTV